MPKLLFAAVVWMLAATPPIQAASKPHVITFGKPTPVKLFVGTSESKSVDMKIRALYVDGKLKEFTTGEAHDVTDQLFTVQRAYRVNDSLPEDERTLPKWKWQRGGWLLVNRATGRIAPIKLPEFDPYYSSAAWYRDYAAYCGVSDTGEKLYAIVSQIGSRKPVVHKLLGPASGGELPDAECARPEWQRQPARVTFVPRNFDKLTFTVRGHAADLIQNEPEATSDESN
jgi:hypothetical protein